MTQQRPSKLMNISLWVIQILLAAMYLMAGSSKLLTPIEELAKQLPWVTGSPEGLVRFIGLSELLGGLGLVLPAALKIKPRLTIFAGIGLALVQLLAIAFHISRGETSFLGMNFVLLALAVFVAWGRSKKAPIHERTRSNPSLQS